MKELVILIPVYQLRLEPLEIMSLSSVRSHCSDYDIRFLAPEGLQLKESITQGIPYLYMPREFFEGFQGYNRLMMSEKLYEAVSEYEFSLIIQLDVLVLRDGIEEFLMKRIDYLGALNWHRSERVLNGGLSLRRNQAFRNILHHRAQYAKEWKGNEDRFYSVMGTLYPDEFHLAQRDLCMRFSYDAFPRAFYARTHVIPLGVHAFCVFDPCFINFLLCQTESEWADYPPFLTICDAQKELLKNFQSFLEGEGKLFLYGAGGWGKIAQSYLKRKHVDVTAFLVSDTEARNNPEQIAGVPVVTVSESLGELQHVRILFCINLRYGRQSVWEILPERLKQMQVQVFPMNFMLYNFMGGAILEEIVK